MPRYIDADKLAEHKFSYVTHDRYVSDGRPKSEEEIYAYKVGYNDAIESIAQFAPTANVVERKVGKWVEPTRDGCVTYDKNAYRECSCCGAKTYLAMQYKFCPNCGAEMKGEDNDEKRG